MLSWCRLSWTTHSWLARRLTAEGIGFTAADNASFVSMTGTRSGSGRPVVARPAAPVLDRYAAQCCPVLDASATALPELPVRLAACAEPTSNRCSPMLSPPLPDNSPVCATASSNASLALTATTSPGRPRRHCWLAADSPNTPSFLLSA